MFVLIYGCYCRWLLIVWLWSWFVYLGLTCAGGLGICLFCCFKLVCWAYGGFTGFGLDVLLLILRCLFCLIDFDLICCRVGLCLFCWCGSLCVLDYALKIVVCLAISWFAWC